MLAAGPFGRHQREASVARGVEPCHQGGPAACSSGWHWARCASSAANCQLPDYTRRPPMPPQTFTCAAATAPKTSASAPAATPALAWWATPARRARPPTARCATATSRCVCVVAWRERGGRGDALLPGVLGSEVGGVARLFGPNEVLSGSSPLRSAHPAPPTTPKT